MVNKIRFFLIMLTFGIFLNGYTNSLNDTLFTNKGSMIITQKKILLENFFQGNIILTKDMLVFQPTNNTQYIKKQELRVADIEKVNNKLFTRFSLIMRNGYIYNMAVLGKEELFTKLDSLLIIRKKNQRNTKTVDIFNNLESSNINIVLFCWSTTIIKPLVIKGSYSISNNLFVFDPSEFNQYIKTIKFRTQDIKSITKSIFPKTITVELISDKKYRFKIPNRKSFLTKLEGFRIAPS